MFTLNITRPDGAEVEQSFEGDQTTIGRHEKCDLCLIDSMVSRHHCLILAEGSRYVVKDLESRNGTWINGRRIKNRRHVKEGDLIQIGPFRLRFHTEKVAQTFLQTQTMDANLVPRHPFVHKQESEEVVAPLGMISNYLSEASGEVQRIPTKVRRERLNRNLLTLYRITEQLVISGDLDGILEYIMDQLFEIFSPSQAGILLRDDRGTPYPRKQRTGDGQGVIRPVSGTILNRVLTDRVGIITDNALEDPRFEMGDSVIIDGIRSVMVAPIWEERSILGAIYVDRLDIVGGFLTEDLDLLTAIGHQTALAIQRWNLSEQLRREAVEMAVIRQNLGRYHSPPVVDLILRGAADLEAKETEATILFCDIVGFTTLCESCSPSELQTVLNLFCKTVSQSVFEERGTLDKFIGDAALTIFGAPLPQEDAPIRAIRAALRIREALRRAVMTFPPGLRFQVRYGINTGTAVVGNFGSDERVDYTVLGHAVNLASRISDAAEPDQILIGTPTYEAVEDKGLFALKKGGSRALKGLKKSMRVYEVLDFV